MIPITPKSKYSIKPSQNESLYEAYHSVFSYVLGDSNVYTLLAHEMGSTYISKPDIEEKILAKSPKFPVIFNDSNEETHYKFFFSETKTIYDPYTYYQIPNSHGNCLFFALYISSSFLNNKHHKIFSTNLINISRFLTKHSYNGIKYMKITKNKQLAYKSFVYNDFLIVKCILAFVLKNKEILEAIDEVWNSLTDEEKIERDIPIDKKFSSAQFLKEFISVFDENIENTWKMTWEQVEIWDLNKDKYTPDKNCGIEGATNCEVNPLEYIITEEDIASLSSSS